VPLNVTQHWNKHDFVQVDTSDILFICAGTFTDLHHVQVDRQVGFGSAGRRMGASRLRVKELIGVRDARELLGRLPVQVQLEELTSEELYRILTEPPDALAREYREALTLDGVDLDLQEGGLRAIVEYSVEKKLGARALRSIMEELLADVMFRRAGEAGRAGGHRPPLRPDASEEAGRPGAAGLSMLAYTFFHCLAKAHPTTTATSPSSCRRWRRTSPWATWAASPCAMGRRHGCRDRPTWTGIGSAGSRTWGCSTRAR